MAGKKKKKSCNNCETSSVQLIPDDGKSKVDYAQPEISPYLQSRIVVISIGSQKYCAPRSILQKFPKWQGDLGWNPCITLADVEGDVGHTIMHFLYTGKYETLRPSTGIRFVEDIGFRGLENHPVETEYRRSVQVYYAARKFELHDLERLAKRYMEQFGESLSIYKILRVASRVFTKLPENEEWFHDYLHSRLLDAYLLDKEVFLGDEFYQELECDHTFSRAISKMVCRVYASRLSSLHESCGLGKECRELSQYDAKSTTCRHEALEPECLPRVKIELPIKEPVLEDDFPAEPELPPEDLDVEPAAEEPAPEDDLPCSPALEAYEQHLAESVPYFDDQPEITPTPSEQTYFSECPIEICPDDVPAVADNGSRSYWF